MKASVLFTTGCLMLAWLLGTGPSLLHGAPAKEAPSQEAPSQGLRILQSSEGLQILEGDTYHFLKDRPPKDRIRPIESTLRLVRRTRDGSAPAVMGNGAHDPPNEPPSEVAVLSPTPGLIIILFPGTEVSTSLKDGIPDLRFQGLALVLAFAAEEDSLLHFSLQGFPIETRRARFLVATRGEETRLSMLEGDVTTLGRSSAKVTESELSGPFGQVLTGETWVLRGVLSTLVDHDEQDRTWREWAQVPGFTTPGPYQRVGEARPSDQQLNLTRLGREWRLSGEVIPIFVGDELHSKKSQRVLLVFDNGDRIKLFDAADFGIDQVSAAHEERGESFLYSLFGKMRALLQKRAGPADLRFKSVTATIGVKGTDFETLASADTTDVAVVEGSVGVANPAGAGEVLVESGMFTTVAADQLPTPPAPIPPERLQQLNSEGFSAPSITIRAPEAGALVRTVRVDYEVIPSGQSVEVLLDDRIITIAPGTSLSDVADGVHRLIVRALGGEGPSASVTFTVDGTPPSLETPKTEGENAPPPKAGEPYRLTFSEAVAEIEVRHDDGIVKTELGEDGLQAQITLPLEGAMTGAPMILTVRMLDALGNEATTELSLALGLPPVEPPQVRIGDGSPTLHMVSPTGLPVQADREVPHWTFILDGIDVTESVVLPLPEGETRPPAREWVLPASLFEGLDPGEHTLEVIAGSGRGDARIGSRETSSDSGSAARASVTVIVPRGDDEPLPVTSRESTGTTVTTSLPGSLHQRYRETIAGETNDPIDRMHLNDRGPFFLLPESWHETSSASSRKGVYRAGVPSLEILRAMNDPALRHPPPSKSDAAR